MSKRVALGVQRLRRAFAARFGRPAQWAASAPGRVNLIGEFTDYNDGFVLPMALERRTTIVAAANGSEQIVMASEATQEALTLPLGVPLTPGAPGQWTNYVKGVLAGCIEAGWKPRGFDALIGSEVPIGAGLSSSAALEVAVASLLTTMGELSLDGPALARLCQHAEQRFAGVPCGIMDPFIAAMGRKGEVLLLDCRSLGATWIRLSDPSVSILLVNTQVRHSLADSEYARRRVECAAAARALQIGSLREASLADLAAAEGSMDTTVWRRARHVISENARVLQAATCLGARDWERLGRLLDASHASLRDDFEVSCRELDVVVDIARGIGRAGGLYGARMTGGGFGGCVVALIETVHQREIIAIIERAYAAQTRIRPAFLGSRAAAGAQVSAF